MRDSGGWSVSFDMDGVLVDSKPSLLESYYYSTKALGLVGKPILFESKLGATLEEIFKTLHPGEDIARLSALFREHSSDRIPSPYPGALETLSQIRTSGLKVAIITNKDAPRAKAIADSIGLEHDLLLSPSLGYEPKPSPQMLTKAIEVFGSSRAIFVGDTSADASASRSAGMTFVHARWGYEPDFEPADYSANSFADIWGSLGAIIS